MGWKNMNLVHFMNYAWKIRQEVNSETYINQCRNLLSHGYVELIKVCDESKIFYTIQSIMVFLMLSDQDFLQGEYDAYCKCCYWANYKPLSVDECKTLYRNSTVDKLSSDVRFISSLRPSVDPEKYESLVMAFCFLSLLGDKALDENEYYILRCFCEEGYDYAPATWAQMKAEW